MWVVWVWLGRCAPLRRDWRRPCRRRVAPVSQASRAAHHLGVGSLKSATEGDNKVAFGAGVVPRVEVADRVGVAVLVANGVDHVR